MFLFVNILYLQVLQTGCSSKHNNFLISRTRHVVLLKYVAESRTWHVVLLKYVAASRTRHVVLLKYVAAFNLNLYDFTSMILKA